MGVSNQPSPYQDNADIPDGDEVFRRVSPEWIDWDAIDPEGRPGVTSQAFQDQTEAAAERLGAPAPGMSVGVASILIARGHSHERMLDEVDPETYGLVGVFAGTLRALGQGIHPWPTDSEPWHAIVFDLHRPRRSKTTRAAIRDAARWIIVPNRRAA